MEAGILKVGTMPTHHYFIWGNKRLADYHTGDKIRFREQKRRGDWERGVVVDIKIDVPVIERM